MSTQKVKRSINVSMNDIQIFKNPQFGEIRTVGTADNPMFCLLDVCKSLGLSAKGVNQRLSDEVISNYPIVDSLGRTQQALFVNEDGLYDVILDSRKPKARQFRKWVTSEVLPVIRKTGGYMVSKQDDTPELVMARALQIANDTIARHEEELADAKNKIARQHDRIGTLEGHLRYNIEEVKKLTPDAEYTRKTLSSTTSWNTNIIAKELGLSAVTLNKRLQGLGIQYKEHGVWVLTHKYQDKGYTKTSTYDFLKQDGSVGTRIQTEWTEKGRRFIHGLSDAGRI